MEIEKKSGSPQGTETHAVGVYCLLLWDSLLGLGLHSSLSLFLTSPSFQFFQLHKWLLDCLFFLSFYFYL